MDRGLACWVAGLLVVTTVAAPAAGAGAPTGPFGVAQEDFDPDDVTLSAALDEDGSAAWSFTYRMELSTENETQAFEELRADIEANRSAYVDRFRSRIVSTVAAAENTTGRNMSVANVSVQTRLQPGGEFSESYGFVEYTFEWREFAAADGERIVAGDALEGFYLNEETSLQFSWPDGYVASDVDPPADQSTATSVQWNGPAEFGTGQPRLVLQPGEPTTTTDAATTAAESGGSDVLLPAFVGALVAVVVVAAAGWFYFRRESGGAGGPASRNDEGGSGGGTGDAATSGDATAAEAGETAGAASSAEPPEELLSNEERVKRFLREQGGRAKQQDVVEAMGWTEAKTSQVVKDMRENDELESFRIGRENVLKLPDADIAEE